MSPTPRKSRGDSDREEVGPEVSELTYTEASVELDGIVEELESGVVDVDRLVEQLERATSIVDELDRRLRRTRMQVEELVPRLEAIGKTENVASEIEDLDGVPPSGGAGDRIARRGGEEPELF
jgi:exodeoxyribonuclease VII small subunit